MATEVCPQCQTPWQAGQEQCPNCGYTMATPGAHFATGETGIRPMPTMPEQPQAPQQTGPQPGAPAAPPPQGYPAQVPQGYPPQQPQAPQGPMEPPGVPPPVQYGQPYNPPGTPPPVEYGYAQRMQWQAQQGTGGSRPLIRPIALLGVVIAAVGTFLPWVSESNTPTKILATSGPTANSYHDIPFSTLFDFNKLGANGIRVGFIFIAVIAVAAAISFVRGLSIVRRILGLLVMVGLVLFGIQLFRGAAHFHALVGQGTFSFFFHILGYGGLVTLVGGVLIAAG